jgi:hypothetical protein
MSGQSLTKSLKSQCRGTFLYSVTLESPFENSGTEEVDKIEDSRREKEEEDSCHGILCFSYILAGRIVEITEVCVRVCVRVWVCVCVCSLGSK